MDEIKKKIEKSRDQASYRIDYLINGRVCTKKGLGEILGITQPTLRLRIEKKDWSPEEIKKIMNINPF